MSRATPMERWRFFASRGPMYATPLRREWVQTGLPDFTGSLHVALYRPDDFLGLADFELFQRYSSSIQQTLIETGAIESAEFFPESEDEGVANFVREFRDSQDRRNQGDIRTILRELGLPPALAWIVALDFEEWVVFRDESELAVSAKARQGFLTMFIVDDV
jgi:hypothetical protein